MEKNRFNVIANSYEEAHRKYPEARKDHLWLLEKANLKANSNVLEVSGGTGFLTKKIADKVTQGDITVHDISENVIAINKEKMSNNTNVRYVVNQDLSFSSLADNYFDISINLGGFHHIEDQIGFINGVMKKLKSGGVMCIGDFVDDSPVQRYFDERIHQLTATGHQGLFASESRFVNLARICGIDDFVIEKKKVPFVFKSEAEIGEFFQLVHSLDQTIEDSFQEIANYFEIINDGEKFLVLVDYIYACYKK